MAPKKKSPKKKGSRRSKAESMTGAKAGKTEVRRIGDNSQLSLPEPDDYAHHLKSIKGCMEKVATASSLLRHAKQSANKSCPGLAASVTETIAIEREGDPVKLQKRLELLGMGLKQIDSSIQLTVFDTLAGDEEELVAKRGYEDGKAARPMNNKYPEGSSLSDLYAENWRMGQAENMGWSDSKKEAAE